ncbi:hypothetical protein ACHAW6_016100 [Cyclotella cf. meneghiniana]
MDEFDFDSDSSYSQSLSSQYSPVSRSASPSSSSHFNHHFHHQKEPLQNSTHHPNDDEHRDRSSLLQIDPNQKPSTPTALRGRTAARRSRKLLRTGADALREARHRTARTTPDAAADGCDRDDNDDAAAYGGKKRTTGERVRSLCDASRQDRGEHSDDSLVRVKGNDFDRCIRGRRRKRRRTNNQQQSSSMSSVASASVSASSWEEDEHTFPVSEFKLENEEESASYRSRFSSQTTNEMAAPEMVQHSPLDDDYTCSGSIRSPFLEFANEDESHHSLKTPKSKETKESLQDSSPDGNNPYNDSIHSPFQSSQSSSRSVRFSLSSNTRHFYLHGYYGTPPGSPQQIYSESPCSDDAHHSGNIVNENSIPSSDHHCTPRSLNGRIPQSNGNANSDSEMATQQSTTENADECETASQSSPTTKTDTQKRRRPRSCLKATTYRSQSTASSSSQSPPSSRFSSSSSYGSSTASRKKHLSRTNGRHFPAPSQESSSRDRDRSPDQTPTVTLGRIRDVSDVQDVGHYRLLVDDLSYLCSAVLQCKRRDGHHTAVTAGAACDLAEVVSESDVQTALLALGERAASRNGSKGGVGALSAVLEAVACAPPVIDVMDVCRDVIEGRGEGNDGFHSGSNFEEEEFVGGDGHGKNVEKPTFGRTKSARRKLGGSDADGESDSNDFVRRKSLEVRDKHDALSAKALSIVAHFVSIICTRAPAHNSNIDKTTVKSARNGVLQHKAALQGLARLVADDPVVDAYLRRVASAVNGAESTTSNDEMIADTVTETIVDDESIASCCTSSSRSSDFTTFSDTKFAVESNAVDPTKFGRRKGRKKKTSVRHQFLSSLTPHLLEPISEFDNDTDGSSGILKWTADKTKVTDEDCKKCDESNDRGYVGSDGKSDCLEFTSDDGSIVSRPRGVTCAVSEKVELKTGVKHQEKIALALSRANLRPTIAQAILASDMNASEDEEEWICGFCTACEPHMMVGSDTEYLSYSSVSAASVALDAADLLICGRDKVSPPTDGDEHSDDEDDSDNFIKTRELNHDQMSENPILHTNEMMRKSGALPDFSRSTAATLASMLLSIRRSKKCNKCIKYLQHRVSTLSVIIDNLCCLSPEVSKALSCPKLLLIPSLLRIVSEIHFYQNIPSMYIEDSALASLKTLTTLTHENSTACHQVIAYCEKRPALLCSCSISKLDSLSCTANGVEIIFSLLYKTVTEMSNHKSGYDTIIFCLNILTNIAETIPSPTKEIFLDLIINGKVKGITWLTQWIVSKTSGFQSAVMKGSFGLTRHDDPLAENIDSELKSGEECNLVTSGNGFVLLSYLILDDDNRTITSHLREKIVRELPIDGTGNSGGIQFMIKTLKAFCNFYHYSVGDLSVAVIAPVIRLITGLEKIHVMEQSKDWL